jgi:biotin carboxylase
MIVTKDGPKIVELGLRLAGDYMTSKMVPLSTGIDMITAAVQIAVGDPIDITSTLQAASCVRYFMKERIGVIKNITGISEAYKTPGIQQVGILKNIGDTATELRGSGDRLGFVITQAQTPEMAIKYAEEAIDKIDFIV